LPVSSFHLRQALVKAFFLDLDLYFGEEQTHKKIRLGTHQGHHKKRLKSEDEAERRDNPSCMLQKPLQEDKKRPREETKA